MAPILVGMEIEFMLFSLQFNDIKNKSKKTYVR